MTEFILSVASVANGATTLNLIHSLLSDSYGCVNHACGAIDSLSRVEYFRRESAIQQSLIRARHILWRDMTIYLMYHACKEFSGPCIAALAKSYP